MAAVEESPKSRVRQETKGVLSPRDMNAPAPAATSGRKTAAAAAARPASPPPSAPVEAAAPTVASPAAEDPAITAARARIEGLKFREIEKELKVCHGLQGLVVFLRVSVLFILDAL